MRDLLRHTRTATAQRLRIQQCVRKVMPRVCPRLVLQMRQVRTSNPVHQCRGHILAQVHVIRRDHSRRGRNHRCQPATLFQARAQLPLRVPGPIRWTHTNAHPARTHKPSQAHIEANDPVQIRCDRLALSSGGGGRRIVEKRNLAQKSHRFLRRKCCRRSTQLHLLALRSLQRDRPAATELRILQHVLHHRRERARRNLRKHQNLVPIYTLNPQVET